MCRCLLAYFQSFDRAQTIPKRQLNPNYAEAHNNRDRSDTTVAYRVKGKVDRAIAGYNIAIQLNPNYADAYKNHWAMRAPLGI